MKPQLQYADGLVHLADLQLRPVRDDDAALVARIYASSREEEMQQVNWPEAQKAAFLQQQSHLQLRQYSAHYPAARYYLIEREGLVLGRVYWQWQGMPPDWTDSVAVSQNTPSNTPGNSPELRLMELTVLTIFRGQGIAAKVIRALQTYVSQHGACMTLHVHGGSPAQAIYQHLGFETAPTSTGQSIYQTMQWRAN
jgi:ribosomal protein S18 acetylase RimI-like enzyme